VSILYSATCVMIDYSPVANGVIRAITGEGGECSGSGRMLTPSPARPGWCALICLTIKQAAAR
jgi:hypothetical protein